MRLFQITEAQHFCTPLQAHVPGVGQSLLTFHRGLPRGTVRLSEGTAYFDAHRVSLLNAVERWILFGVADYRRALDMLIPSNVPWAHVTLYYASFFAANALLGMFGAWVHYERIVDVEDGTPTSQKFRIDRKFRSPSGYQGSHQVFWDFFYEGCNTFGPWVPPHLSAVITPVNNDRVWQIRARNEVNYDMFGAFEASRQFSTTFNPRRLRSVGGPLRQQLDVTEGMLKLAIHFVNYFGLSSFALDPLGIPGKRSRIMRALVTRVPPSLTVQSALQELLA